MKKALLGALIGLVVIINCADDIYVAPASPIYGVYYGEYKVVRQTDAGTKTKRARVEWTFSDQTHWFKVLEVYQDENICSFSADYKISNTISLDTGSTSGQQCDRRDVPLGDFSFQRIATAEGRDSLYLIQVQAGDDGWTKEGFLLKDTTAVTP